MKRSGELRNGRDLWRYHLSARTGHHTLSSWTEEWEDKDGRKISTGPEEADLILRKETGLRNQTYTRRFPTDVPRVNGKSMKRTTTLSRRYSHQEHRFEREMVERGLGQRLKRRTGQGSEKGREAPRRNEGTNRGILKEECTEMSGQMDRGRHRRAVWESSMNRCNSGAITLDSCKGFLLVKKMDKKVCDSG